MVAVYVPISVVSFVAIMYVLSAWLIVVFMTRKISIRAFPVVRLTPYELGFLCEDVRFTAADGWPLFGWWAPSPGSRRTIVLCSGYRGNKSDIIALAPFFRERGFNVFAIDLRGQGASKVSPVTMGYREALDVSAAVSVATEKVPGGAVGVLGYSMGGVSCLLAASGDPYVRAVVTDSAYANARDLVSYNMRTWTHIPGEVIMPVLEWFMQLRLGFRLSDVDLPTAAARLSCPLLVIHGASDSLVPPSHANAIYDAAPGPKEKWFVQGAEHVGAYHACRDEYIRRVAGFFGQHLGSPAPNPVPEGQILATEPVLWRQSGRGPLSAAPLRPSPEPEPMPPGK